MIDQTLIEARRMSLSTVQAYPAARAGWDETARAFFPEEEAAATYARNPARPMQLDHFFASPDLASTATPFEVIRTDPFRDASDHAPILAEFELTSPFGRTV